MIIIERHRNFLFPTSDPRSASDDVTRTPIAAAENCETPVKTLALIDPRSPGCVLGGEVVVERTPILVMSKKDETSGDTPMRGSTIPPFQLPASDTSGDNDVETPAPTSDSPLIMKTQNNKTSTPSTIPLTHSKSGQPSNLLQVRWFKIIQTTETTNIQQLFVQERLKEAASAAMKDQSDVGGGAAPAAAGGEFLDDSDLKHENDISDTEVRSDNNDSSLII